MALTHSRAQSVAEAVERAEPPAAGELLLLCTTGLLYCVALVENSTVWLSVVMPCTSIASQLPAESCERLVYTFDM